MRAPGLDHRHRATRVPARAVHCRHHRRRVDADQAGRGTRLEPRRPNLGEPIRAGAAVAERDRHGAVVLPRLDERRQLDRRRAAGGGHAHDIAVVDAQPPRGGRRENEA